MKEFTVRIKDNQQDTTHVTKQYANSQREANLIILGYLKEAFDHDDFELI
jgi:hypothetical protein